MLVIPPGGWLFATADMLKFTPLGFAFSVINFLILAALLYRFLHQPLLAALEKRQNDIERVRQEADQARAEADELKADYEQRSAELEQERAKLLADAKREAGAAGRKLIEKAQKEADAKLRESERDWERREQDALEEFREQLEEVGLGLAEAVLRELADSDISAKLQERLKTKLDELRQELSPAERRALLSGNAPVDVITATRIDDDARAAIAEKLKALVESEAVTVNWGEDESLGAGTRIEFVSMAVDATLASVIESCRPTNPRDDAQQTEGESKAE